MADSVGFVNMIKRVALAAVGASKPVEACFGRVAATSPLEITVEQKIRLGRAQLVVPRHVTDHVVMVSGGDGTASGASRDAAGRGQGDEPERRLVTIHNGLAVDDQVLLLRQQGGQKYIVWDRLS